MAEELGRIEKPSVEGYKKGRKLYFVPLVYRGDDSPEEYTEKYERYWKQVADQIAGIATEDLIAPLAAEDDFYMLRG